MKTLPHVAAASPRSLERPSSVDSACSSRSSSPNRTASSNTSSNQSGTSREEDQAAAGKPARKWQRREKIGQGAQGCVYRSLEAATGREAACKVILLRDLSGMEVEAIKREVSTIKRLKHPRLVRYWRATEVPRKRLSIYMEFVAGGSLSGRLRREGPLPLELVKKLTRQLCEALAFLHGRGIAHRDIKCANVFLTTSSDDADIKLGDFGALKETGCASLVGGLKGTPHWMAPEVIRGVPPPASDATGSSDSSGGETWWFRADIWSLGCAVLEMLTAHAPWQQYSNPHTAMYQIVATDKTPTIPADASDETVAFIQRCLQRDPISRASIAELLMHPFLGEGDMTASSCGVRSKSSGGTANTADPSDSDDSNEAISARKMKTATRCSEPESSPTARSEDGESPLSRSDVCKPEGNQHRSRGPSDATADGHVDAEEAMIGQPAHDQQHPDEHTASHERLRPSRIPRLKALDPLKKMKKKTPSACIRESSTNNNAHNDANRMEQFGPGDKQLSKAHTSPSQLPRLVAVDKSTKKREFAIPKHSLMPSNPIALAAATAPLKPAVVARRTVRAISPLQQRRAATAPAPETASTDTSGAAEPAVSSSGDGACVTRLKLPPLTATRAATASSSR